MKDRAAAFIAFRTPRIPPLSDATHVMVGCLDSSITWYAKGKFGVPLFASSPGLAESSYASYTSASSYTSPTSYTSAASVDEEDAGGSSDESYDVYEDDDGGVVHGFTGAAAAFSTHGVPVGPGVSIAADGRLVGNSVRKEVAASDGGSRSRAQGPL